MKSLDATGSNLLRKRSLWPWAIIGMLGFHVLIMMAATVLATHGHGFAVVPDYYQRGLHWDAEQAVLRASDKLGWHVDVVAGTRADATGQRAVRFVLTDKAGKAVPNAQLDVEYFHHANADKSRLLTLSPDSDDPTCFTQMLQMPHAGTWEFHFRITAGDKTFIGSQVQTVSNTQPAQKPGPV